MKTFHGKKEQLKNTEVKCHIKKRGGKQEYNFL